MTRTALLLSLLATGCAVDHSPALRDGVPARAWGAMSDPDRLGLDMEETLSALPLSGTADKKPWPGSYWPTYTDSINHRWAGPTTASPSEKYAEAFGLTGLPDRVSAAYGIDSRPTSASCTVDSQCSSGEACAIRDGHDSGLCIETWFGICHAWAPAAVLQPAPQHPVVHNGVTFEVNDLRALVALTHDKGLTSKTVSLRCNEEGGDIALDAYGNPVDESCRDTNPGTFHVVTANLLGLQKRAFIEDRTWDSQVWNQPVYAFDVVDTRPVTNAEANRLLGAAASCEQPAATASSSSGGGFDWGGACEGGSGSFNQPIAHQDIVTVGDIPAGKADVRIELVSGEDVDIQLIDETTGHEIIAWPNGDLSGARQECTTYEGVQYCYSGYNGGQTATTKGHEWIEVRGETNRTLVMKAFGYAAGDAEVDYSWAAPADCTDSGCGSFTQPIAHQDIVAVGGIPAGKDSVRITLTSDEDVDIQLVDEATGHEIVAWPNGDLNGADEECAAWQGVEYCYSGYNGGQSATTKGHEWIEVRGRTNRPLLMKAFGYAAGDAQVDYAWGEGGSEAYAFNPEAASLVYMKTDLSWVHEPAQSVDGPLATQDYTTVDTYEYIVELDAAGRIFGGEWVGSSRYNHPDLLWIPTSKYDVAIAQDGWDDSTGITWTAVQQLLEQSVQ